MSEAARIKGYEAIEAAENAELLNKEEEIPEEEQIEEVAVLDDASAEYLLRRMAEANEQYDRMEAWYAFQLKKAKELRDRTIEWTERCLRAYFDMVPTKDSKTQKKYELPSGTLILKAQQPDFTRDDAAVMEWLKQNNGLDYIKTKESLDWAEFKKTLEVVGNEVADKDGEIVPGITVEQREPVFQVKLK